MKLTDEELLERLRVFYRETGRVPRTSDVSNKVSYQRRFGTWNTALDLAGLPVTLRRGPARVEHPCLGCQGTTKNPKFCSQSCAATYNNHVFPKRKAVKKEKPEASCRKCKINPVSSKWRMCELCKIDYNNMTLGELKYSNGPNNYRAIRDRARKLYKDKLTECQECGYDKHVEVCHITAIKDFPDDTPVSVINDPSNIAILCPNCHWEMDHQNTLKM